MFLIYRVSVYKVSNMYTILGRGLTNCINNLYTISSNIMDLVERK